MFVLGGLFIIVHRVVQSKQVGVFCKFYSSNVTYIAFIMYHSPVGK